MAETTPVNASGKPKLQRYALRSATKSKEEKPIPTGLSSISSASKRERPAPSVSKSVGVLDLTEKDSSAKPPRRLSIPTKSSVSSASKVSGNITPISGARSRRAANGQGKNETPISSMSRSTNRINSASYWLMQIKLSEYAAKHSISFGFFKLALEAGCEPLQRMRDELKSYVQRNLHGELGEPVKELLESYGISENFEQLQVSETFSQMPDEGNRSSDDDVLSSSSTLGTGKLEPKCLNIDAAQLSPVKESSKKDIRQKNTPDPRVRETLSKSSANSRSVSETATRKSAKKPEKLTKQAPAKGKDKSKKLGKSSDAEEGVMVSDNPSCPENTGNKEN